MKKLTPASVIGSIITRHLDKMNTKGKAKAGEGGNLFEAVVLALKEMNFEVCDSCKRDKKPRKTIDMFGDGDDRSSPNRIECNAPYNSVLKQTAERLGIKTRQGVPHTEFVLVTRDIKPTIEFPNVITGQENRIRVECKYQNTSGTTEHKLLHSYLDLQYGAPEPNVILLVDGKGFTEKMVAFIREVCEENTIVWTKGIKQSKKSVVFMNIAEFIDWANRAF